MPFIIRATSLFVVGGVDPVETMNLIRSNQAGKSYEKQGSIERLFDPEPQGVERSGESRLAVSLPKCLFGFKEKHVGLTAEERAEI